MHQRRYLVALIALGMMAISALPARANNIIATASANCQGYSLTLSATDLTVGTSYTFNYSFTVTCGLGSSSPTTVTVQNTLSFTATASTYSTTVTGGAGWNGTNLTNSCQVAGAVTITGQDGSSSTNFIDINGTGSDVPVPLMCSTLALSCPANAATVGVPYNSAWVASGGVPPYSFSLLTADSTVPAGLSVGQIGPDGTLTGTPTTAGTYSSVMDVTDSAGNIAYASCTIVTAALQAPNTIQLFSPVDTEPSFSTTSFTNPDSFNTTNLNLTCNASPIIAFLSGPLMNSTGSAPALSSSGALQPGGNLLVDNNVLVTVTPAGGAAQGPVNVCTNGYNVSGEGLYSNSCFNNSSYGADAATGELNGNNPDTFLPPGSSQTVDSLGGVPPIDISSNLVAGSQLVQIALSDQGGWVTGSTLFLGTNCTQGSVTGPAQVTGNQITSTPTPSQLTQSFTFNPTTGQQVGLVYDLSQANAANTLTGSSLANSPNPITADSPLDPAQFQPVWVAGTPFATSSCLIHTGESLTNGTSTPACKLYKLECATAADPTPSGAQCPVSTANNEAIQDIFDGPAFTLSDIPTPHGPTFHEGIGFLMAAEPWAGGPCTFSEASGLENLPCPQNLLTSFSGPGTYSSDGRTTHPNSNFITVAGVPEDLTWVFVAGELPDNWINRRTATVNFFSQPPNLIGATVPGAANFIPSRIQSVTYGISPAGSVPVPAQEPIPNDITLVNPAANCSTPPTARVAPNFVPSAQKLTFPADGQYLLHYFAQDCAGTQELLFTQTSGNWSTNFYTQPINVDTVPPAITGPTLSAAGPFKVGQAVYASYACSDATSGVVLCGLSFYPPGSTLNTGTLTTKIDTTSPGQKTFFVLSSDAALNLSTASVRYTVTK